ncbi:MAG: IPTL-CTERM sorting domain-containing protein, partial [Phycisphaerae bacterium]
KCDIDPSDPDEDGKVSEDINGNGIPDECEGVGACCDVNTETCSHKPLSDCDGAYQGEGTFCGVCTEGTGTGLPCDGDDDCNDPPIAGACKEKVCSNDPAQECEIDMDCPQPLGVCVDLSTVCATQACCDPETGNCREVTKPEDCLPEEDGHGYGTDCVPPCCVQPEYSGRDNCGDFVDVQVINVPPVGADPVSITITGNNTTATSDDWDEEWCRLPIFDPDGDTKDPGWWEAFEIDACANVRIQLCCTDPVLEPAWGFLLKGCPCGETLEPVDLEKGPIGTPTWNPGFGRGEPFCDDRNLWMTFGPLEAGTYYYPIYSADDGTCASPPGCTYQLHITVGYCADAACCYLGCTGDPSVVCETDGDCTAAGGTCEPQCLELNELECESRAGWLTDSTPCDHTAVTGTCETGSCCLEEPGVCEDEDPARAPTMTKDDCDIAGGTYVGGADCANCYGGDNNGASCSDDDDCPDGTCRPSSACPWGACCTAEGCEDTIASDCDGEFFEGLFCSMRPCNPPGPCVACCLEDGTCIRRDVLGCEEFPGTAIPDPNWVCWGDSNQNGADDFCEGIPTVSEWGMVAMTLLMLTAGTLVLKHRRPVQG